MIFKLLLAISLIFNAQASTHTSKMNQINFNYVANKTLFLENGEQVTVTYHGYNAVEAQAAFKSIQISSEYAQSFLKQNGFESTSCVKTHLNFYDVDTQTLHNKKLMTFIEWAKLGDNMIYAYFDSVDSPPGKVSIFMTAPKKYDPQGLDAAGRAKIITHEMMHYWQDRTCNKTHDVEIQADQYMNFISNHSTF
jgi:hypothetical protein|tara:strand:+ start:8309 stop:8890 length:582 start_codon:yes stop_codon:yes gene_type:complete